MKENTKIGLVFSSNYVAATRNFVDFFPNSSGLQRPLFAKTLRFLELRRRSSIFPHVFFGVSNIVAPFCFNVVPELRRRDTSLVWL